MTQKGRNISLVVVVIVLVYICFINRLELSKLLQSTSPQLLRAFYQSSNTSSSSSLAAAASAVKWISVGRQPDDGVWIDFSDPPSFLFYAYSAFVDQRPLDPRISKKRLLFFSSLEYFLDHELIPYCCSCSCWGDALQNAVPGESATKLSPFSATMVAGNGDYISQRL